MIGKLIKLELKSTYKRYMLIFAIFLFSTLAVSMSFTVGSEWLFGISMLALSICSITMVAFFFVSTIERYNKSMFGNESYLSFTLPIKAWQLVLSKTITPIIWGITTLFVGLVSLLIYFFTLMSLQVMGEEFISDLIGVISAFLDVFPAQYCLLLLVTAIFAGLQLILQLYFSISVANLPQITKWNSAVALILFFIISQIEGEVLSFVVRVVVKDSDIFLNSPSLYFEQIAEFLNVITQASVVSIIISIVFSALYFFGVTYFATKKVSIK